MRVFQLLLRFEEKALALPEVDVEITVPGGSGALLKALAPAVRILTGAVVL